MVVVGGGFGGLQAVLQLGAPVEVTLVDRRNFHLFQPLAYQVATGALSPGEIASPLRAIFKRDANVRVLLAEVTGIDLERRASSSRPPPNGDAPRSIPYDTLIVAGGVDYSYFGHDDWRPFAPELKSLEGALDIRRRILAAFEAAELEPDPERRAAWLTFVVVGAGPTGVEMAGQIAEIARDTLRRDFRDDRPARRRGSCWSRPPTACCRASRRGSRRKAARALERLGVTPLLGHAVVDDRRRRRSRSRAGDGDERAIAARTVIWAAGVDASPLARHARPRRPAPRSTAPAASTVEPDLTLPGPSRGVRARRHGARARRRRRRPAARASRRWRCSRAATPRA